MNPLNGKSISENPKVSVVIPVYNSEKYLGECICSVINQTYKNLEIILVNDGSTDGCREIIDQFAQDDSRIIPVSQENQGVQTARNNGVAKATGEYIVFIDSDDIINKDFVKLLLLELEKNDSDIAYSPLVFCVDSELQMLKKLNIENCKHSTKTYTSEKAIKGLLYQKIDSTAFMLYKRELFDNGLRFDNRFRTYEDLMFCFRAFAMAKKITEVHLQMYYYTKRETGTLLSLSARRHDAVEITDIIINEAKDKKQRRAAMSRQLSICFYGLRISSALAEKEWNNEFCNEYWQRIKKLRAKCFTDIKMRTKNKLAIILSLFGKKTLMRTFKLFDKTFH